MRVGVSLPSSGPFASPAFLRRFARACDGLGYDSVWAPDHITWTTEDAAHDVHVGSVEAWRDGLDPDHYEPMPTLAYVAGLTSRIRVGTCVLVLPVHNPVVLAKQVASLDRLSGGRVMLGVGIGGTAFADAEFGAVGEPGLRPHRGRVTDEWIEIMRCVWSQPVCRYRGQFIEIVDASIFPKPAQQAGPPILIGGDSPAALRRVARLADGSIVTRLAPSQVTRRREELATMARSYGRSEQRFQLAVRRWLSIADNEQEAKARAARTVSATRRRGSPAADSVPHLIGTASRLQDVLADHLAAGVDEVIVQVIGGCESAVLDSLQQFSEDVLDKVLQAVRSDA